MSTQPNQEAGLGNIRASLKVYLGNRPEYQNLLQLQHIQALGRGEIGEIGKTCGNGWRKVFNVYAKLVFALPVGLLNKRQTTENWQAYRDNELLQPGSETALMFSAPTFETDHCLHIIIGRTYALSLPLPTTLEWLDAEFAIDWHKRIIICPYFDYRQLSNIKIIRLVELIATMYEKNPPKTCCV